MIGALLLLSFFLYEFEKEGERVGLGEGEKKRGGPPGGGGGGGLTRL